MPVTAWAGMSLCNTQSLYANLYPQLRHMLECSTQIILPFSNTVNLLINAESPLNAWGYLSIVRINAGAFIRSFTGILTENVRTKLANKYYRFCLQGEQKLVAYTVHRK